MSIILKPNAEFYNCFNERQIIDMISLMENQSMIPHKYVYMANKEHFGTLETATKYKTVSDNNSKLLNHCLPSILETLQDFSSVNIIDIGCGTGLVVKSFIENLNYAIKINQYIGLDSSQDMADLASNNIRHWYPDIKCESLSLDIDQEEFFQEASLYLDKYLETECPKLFLFIGGTITNNINPIMILEKTKSLMNRKDVMIFSSALPIEPMCSIVDYIYREKESFLYIPKLIGMEADRHYTFSAYYDDDNNKKLAEIVPLLDIHLEIATSFITKRLILKKNTPINLWFSQQYLVGELLNHVNQAKLDNLLISKLRHDYLIYFVCV